jgi:flagellar basal body rod protein FlgC
MQWLQDPNQNNVDNLNNIRLEASRYFRKKEEHLIAKIDDLEVNGKVKNRELYREINDFKKYYQPRNELNKDTIWLQTPTVFWLDGRIIYLNY